MTSLGDRDPRADADLIGHALLGDVAAFEALARRYYGAAYAIALARAGNREDALDICQDAFIAAAEQLDRCADPARFAAWLFAIVRNRSHNLRRAQQVRRTEPLDDEALSVADRHDPARQVNRLELRAQLEAALNALPIREREVVLLFDLDGWTHREIAASLGISETMSRQHLFVARRTLRTRLPHPAEARE